MNSDGSGRQQLTDVNAQDFHPRWSPDGRQIAFLSTRDGSLEEISVMASDGSDQRRLTRNDAFDGAPSWSPDSTQLVFASDRDGNHELYVMNSDGANVQRLTDNSAADRKPAWQPLDATSGRTNTDISALAVVSVDTADKVDLFSILSGHHDKVNDLSFSGDGATSGLIQPEQDDQAVGRCELAGSKCL